MNANIRCIVFAFERDSAGINSIADLNFPASDFSVFGSELPIV